MTIKQKTAEELKALLDDRIARFQLGSEPNTQFIKIVPDDPNENEEGANWKVAHSGAPGKLANAIDRVTPELQRLYKLKTV